jgi:ABC-type sugar transport system ATPase subunit
VPRYSPGWWLRNRREHACALRQRKAFGIKVNQVEQPVATLSGGNQQKVVLAKWLETQPRVLLLDEPTRGVDVGAKHEIYELMNQWTQAGIAILLITSEMPELLALSDRILVMHRGRVTAELSREQASQEREESV